MTGKQQRRLVATVHVGGKRYGPGDEIPDDVAEQITNPHVWASDDESDGGASGSAGGGRRRGDGPQLASFVHVGGRRFGPGDDVPPEVAKQITNPKAWEGGKLPDFADGQDEPDGGSGQPESGGGKSGDSSEPGDNGDNGDGAGSNPGEPASPATPRVPAPPRSGPGSGKDAWEAWANTQGLTYPKGAAKADIIDAAEQAGLIEADAK